MLRLSIRVLLAGFMLRINRYFLLLLVALALFPGRDGLHLVDVALAQQLPGGSTAATGANVAKTRHNLTSGAPTRQTTSQNAVTSEEVLNGGTDLCVFCHTPHGAYQDAAKPLWNRQDSVATYTGYSSSTLDATDLDVTATGLTGSPSKLCLSCHDGSIALGTVANTPGSGTTTPTTPITVTGFGTTAPTPAGTMPYGRNLANPDHGFTRRLNTDLRNDHPISFTYNTALATADGEIRDPSTSPPTIANRVIGQPKPDFPLTGGKVQCTTCHDPHRNTQKFLLKNRMVVAASTQTSWTNWTFDGANDQICMGCHTRLGKAWQQSAHADSTAANEAYTSGDGAMRDFQTGATVWQAGCLNCHDTHTVAGSRRLLREGVGSGTVAPAGLGYTATIRTGTASTADYNTTSAIENTCYQCHSGTPVITVPTLSAAEGVPNIQGEFAKTYRMPITNSDQGDPVTGNAAEIHDITSGDFQESPTQLGLYASQNRHVECTDCHNPHRVVKANTFLGNQLNDAGSGVTKDLTRRTHGPAAGTTGNYGNIASGALRGAWGVEPSYTATLQTTVTSTSIWLSAAELPTYTVKKGDPGVQATLPVGTSGTNLAPYLTREYQLCFKCHSNYSNGPLATDFPSLKSTSARGTTASGTNSVTRYTNVAAEFAVLATDPPTSGTHQGEATNIGNACGGGDCVPVGASWDTNAGNASTVNHRSWHPVSFPTGRTSAERGLGVTLGNIRAPFNNPAKIGQQTMHCSDCHGSSGGLAQAPTTAGASSWIRDTGPNLAQVQGPHGSESPFLLKGSWSIATVLPSTDTATQFCGNCHNPQGASGFAGGGEASHTSSKKVGRPCMWCHIAVPHGWRNKNFLVNLNCVGAEGGGTGCQSNVVGNTANLTAAPYYVAARLRVLTWQRSGSWSENSCDFVGGSKGGDYMRSACGDQ